MWRFSTLFAQKVAEKQVPENRTETRESSARPSTPSLMRGLLILEALAGSRRGITLSEIACRLKIPKSTTQRLVRTLLSLGYLTRDESSKRFFITGRLSDLSRLASESSCLCQRTHEALRDLRRDSGLTANLALLQDGEAVIKCRLENASAKDSNWVGKHLEMHSTALGKAILAHLPKLQVEDWIQVHGLSRHNANTIHSAGVLRDHLRTIRYRGFALDNEEDELGYRHAASPIFDRVSHVVGSVDVAGTTRQISAENLADLADLVKDAAARISSFTGQGVGHTLE